MDKFDITEFNSHAVNNNYSFKLRDSTSVEQAKDANGYTETITPPKGWLYEYRAYYPSGQPKEQGHIFILGNFMTGVWEEYDQQGNLVKKVNNDLPYKLSMDDIFKILEKEKIPFTRGNSINKITRNVIDSQPIWAVEWQLVNDRIELIEIDDKSGNIIKRTFYNFEGDH